jgi:pimeloyl-ACP methyl ester carboxylesterase
MYFFQEKLIFFPEKLEQGYEFNYDQDFEELNIKVSDGKVLNGLLFTTKNSKGLIFYLHGNSGSLGTWGDISSKYTNLNYDVFILDYRSFGKSGGTINSESQLFEDNQLMYNELRKRYNEENIIILGHSIGTGLASKLASENKPKYLILLSPYYSLTDMMLQRYPFAPTFLLKYKFATHDYLEECTMPITIFHGNTDEVIPFESSIKLTQDFSKIKLIELNGQGHSNVNDNVDYIAELTQILF